MVTQVAIARRVGLDVSSVNKILNRKAGSTFQKETVDRVFRTARRLGYDFGRLRHTHCRRHARKSVSIPAALVLYQKDGSIHDQGRATILDLSSSGARISDLRLPLNTLPIPPFSVGIRKVGNSEDDAEIRGRIVRMHANGGASMGLEFTTDDQALGRRVRQIAKI